MLYALTQTGRVKNKAGKKTNTNAPKQYNRMIIILILGKLGIGIVKARY